MKRLVLLTIIIFYSINLSFAQNDTIISRINLLLLNGEYERIIDTCKLILTSDSLNSKIYYTLGVAYQNSLNDDQCLKCFSKAVNLNPDNKVYSFSLAKESYSVGELKLAIPLLAKLYSSDSLNWAYAYYLSSIYMQLNRFDDAINIYRRFLKKEPTNYVYIDKIAFAYLKKGNMQVATDLYQTSLSI